MNTQAKWEDPPYPSEEYDQLCEASTPDDFYFAAKTGCFVIGEEATLIAITPKSYFDKHHYSWDQGMYLKHILPTDFSEAMEGVWECDRSLEEVKSDMLARGFIQNSAFDQEVDEDYD